MTAPEPSLLAQVRAQVETLADEVRELALLRWELARSELQSDLAAAKRLAIALIGAVAMALCGLPLLVGSLADVLDGTLGIARCGWLALFGLLLLSGAGAAAFFAWRRFRARFTGLRQSLEELREDLVWLQEWTAKARDPAPRDGDPPTA